MVPCTRNALAVDPALHLRGQLLTSCNTEASHEIVRNCPDGCLQLERCPVGCDETVDWKANNEGDIQPVDVLVPVGLRNGLLGDVRLLGIVLLVAVRLRRFGHAKWRLLYLRGHDV
jgi:hypothetical protein